MNETDDIPIGEARNIGPQTASWLREIGIITLSDLSARGVSETYEDLKESQPGVSLNALSAMDATLADIHWLNLTPERRATLRAALADCPGDSSDPSDGQRYAAALIETV